MNQIDEELFQAMLYKIASDPAVIKSVSGNIKDELWLERQELKRWYEERTDGLPGDEYIGRCTRMVDWWLQSSGTRQDVIKMFRDFVSQDQENGISSRSIADAKSDVEDLKSLLTQQYEAAAGSDRWFVLAEAVAECAVGSLIEINEDISENVEEDHLRLYFEEVRDFWDSFFDVTFQGQEPSGSEVEPSGQRTPSLTQERAQVSNNSTAATSDTSSDSQVIKTCTSEALEMIASALDDRSHELNQAGGFSKIPDDFKFLGVLRLALEFGHLKREGLLLYACLNSYCVTLLRKFFILQRNQKLEQRDVQPSARIQELINAASDGVISALQNLVQTRAQAQFQSLQNFRASSPTAARISFESQLPDALDMALAALREAMGQAAGLETSEGIEQSEGLAAVMLAYAPKGFDDFESRFRQSPWAFYNTTDLCISVLEGTVSNPKRFIDHVFEQWQEFQKDDTRNSEINRHHKQLGDDGTLEATLGRGEISDSCTTTPHDPHNLTAQNAPVDKTTITSSQTPLVGAALIQKVKAMGDSTPGDQARGCGYILSGQPQTGDVEAFYAALYESYRAVRK